MKHFKLGIIANTGKPQISEMLPAFLNWLVKKSVEFYVADDIAEQMTNMSWTTLPVEKISENVDFVLSFGGDGTFLHTAHTIGSSQVPIIGVNLGAFGYLAEVSFEQLRSRIRDLQNDDYSIQDRFMLTARIQSDQSGELIVGLNDIVIEKGAFPRTIRLETSIDGIYLNTFIADGLIVSTPTGSTGYSLSVGGPIIDPDVNIMIISPISPHMLANRPLVVDGRRKVEVVSFSEAGSIQITADGQQIKSIQSGSKVAIERAPYVTKVVHFPGYSFYNLLRNKLHWRTRVERGDQNTVGRVE